MRGHEHRGRITRIMDKKRYGFITVDGGGDAFFHESSLRNALWSGWRRAAQSGS